MELFDENNYRKYSQETIINAYENMEWVNNEGEFTFPDGDFFFVVFESPKENIEHIVKNVFSDIYLINSFVQKGSDEYEIAGFTFNHNVISIQYWHKEVNSQFDVEIYKDENKWYCTNMGALKYAQPVCVNDFPNGYSTEHFEMEIVREGSNMYYKLLNSVVEK
jgi:hypothetical protein